MDTLLKRHESQYPTGFDIPHIPLQYANNVINRVTCEDSQIHNWYRFVLSFPPEIVRKYLNQFDLPDNSVVLDPFCGTGTTVLEARLNGYRSIGVERNPVAFFSSVVKNCLNLDVEIIERRFKLICRKWERNAKRQIDDSHYYLSPEKEKLIIKNSISPVPLAKVLSIFNLIENEKNSAIKNFLKLALINITVDSASNLRFGPEVGVGKIITDADVFLLWREQVQHMLFHLTGLRERQLPEHTLHNEDARFLDEYISSKSVDAVFTSPPYPNEKDYSRTTRLELILFNFIESMSELREMKKGFVRSNTRSVYKDDTDHNLIRDNENIQNIAREIERRRIELHKDSGFEKQYHKVVLQYFGGMKKHLIAMKKVLKPGAYLGYVVGDQASYLQVMIKTGELLAEIADEIGYEIITIDHFRYRAATATKKGIDEQVLVLRWNG